MISRKAQAVVMAGGFGTRLLPLTAALPKPMVPVANRPIMEHVVRLLKRHGFTEIVILLYFQPDRISGYFGDGRRWGVNIRYLRPDGDYGTAGSVRAALDLLDDRFLIISGDVLTDFDLNSAFRFHEENQSEATLVLARQENPLPYGVVITDADHRITRFLEKPSWGEVFSDTVNSGVYALEKEGMAPLPIGRFVDFGRDLFPRWLGEGKAMYGFVADGYWRDIGNVEDYTRAHTDILHGRVRLEIAGEEASGKDGAKVFRGAGVHIAEDAVLSGKVILGDRVTIGPGSRIENSVIGSGTEVNAGTVVRGSIVWSDVRIGANSDIAEAIICDRAQVGEQVTVLPQAILADDVRLGRAVVIKANCKVWPGKEVESGSIVSTSVVWGDKWNRELFTDAKVSGLANLEITPEFAARLGAAFGSIFPAGVSVLVACDATNCAHIAARSLMAGLSSSGVEVLDLRMLPIPVVRYELKSGREAAGVYIRRSPLNAEHLDMIFFDSNGKDLSNGNARSVERAFFQENFRRARPSEVGGLEYPQRPWDIYRQEFIKSLDLEALKKAGLRVVLDYAHGVTAGIFPAILGSLGAEVVSLNSSIDPDRASAVLADIPAALDHLSRIVTALRFDLGVFIDPGAEKMHVVDEQGHVFTTPELLIAMTDLVARTRKPERIAAPVLATMGLDRLAEEAGFELVRVRNDHLAMMEAAELPGIGYVGGTRGGFIFPEFQRGADAPYAVARLLEMLARTGAKVSDLVGRIVPGYYKISDIPCPWARKGRVMRRLIDYTAGMRRDTVDGVRIVLDGRWVMVAPDRRQAAFYVVVEGPTEQEASTLLEEYRRLVIQWRDIPDGVERVVTR